MTDLTQPLAPQTTPEPEPEPAPEKPAIEHGDLVVYKYVDHNSVERQQTGVVVLVDPADPAVEGSFARAVVAWYAGVSGPMDVADLEAIK